MLSRNPPGEYCGSRWRGDYNECKQKWFPSNYVEEIDQQPDLQAPLGNLQQGSLDICRCSVGTYGFVYGVVVYDMVLVRYDGIEGLCG